MRYDYEGKPFTAYDRDGRGYYVSPVYRFEEGCSGGRKKTFAPESCVGLLTEDGRWIRRDRPGCYAILRTGALCEIPLSSRGAGPV